MALSELIKVKYPQSDLFVIQAGLPQKHTQLDNLSQVFTLPHPFMNRQHFRQALNASNIDSVLRSKICSKIIHSQNPKLFITETFPLGHDACRYELIPSLVDAARGGSRIWSIAGYPLLTGKSQNWKNKVMGLYEKIFICCPQEEKIWLREFMPNSKQRIEHQEFFDRYAAKINFIGYFLPQGQLIHDKITKFNSTETKFSHKVLVLRGSGAVYPKLIAQAILASDDLPEYFEMTIVTGPATTNDEWQLFNRLMHKKRLNNVKLLRVVSHYEDLIKVASVCVATSGYHTSAMLLKYRKRAVLVPFEGYDKTNFYEQKARAAMLKEKIGAQVISIKELNAKNLLKAILIAAQQKESKQILSKGFFGASSRLNQALTELFGRSQGQIKDQL